MKRLTALLSAATFAAIAAMPLDAEDMLSRQSGQAIPPGVWTRITPINGPALPKYQSYDNFTYVPVTGRTYALETYKDLTTETNRTLFGYSAEENRWDFVDEASTAHDEHMLEGGHGDNRITVDPTTGYIYLLNGSGSGSAGNEFTFGNWRYDPVGQAGRVFQSMLRTFVNSAEYSAMVDYTRGVVLQYGTGGTQEYSLANNTWGAAYCTSGTGSCPPSNLQEACMVWNTADQSIYLFGGIASGTARNILYKNHAGTWSIITPSGTPPSARAWPGCAYDTRHNLMVVYGGCSAGGGCGATSFTDTFVLDFSASAWSAGPAGPSAPASVAQIAEKLAYDERMDVFIAGIRTPTSADYQLWALRLYSGQNLGYKTGTVYTQAASNIGAYFSGSSGDGSGTAWAKKPWVTVNGSTVFVGWDETGAPSDVSNGQYEHPYSADIQTGTPVFVPNPVDYNAMMGDIGGKGATSTLSNDVSCAFVGSTRWCSWLAHNTSTVNYNVYGMGYTPGVGWNLGGQVGKVNVGGGTALQQHSVMLNVNGVPTVVFQEVDKINGAPYRNFVYVKQCTGSPCSFGSPLGGTFLNRTNSTNPFLPHADSISATYTSGSDFLVAWSEYNSIGSSSESDSPFNVYVTCWCSGALAQYGGSWNVTPGTVNTGNPPSPPNSGDSAYQPSITYLSGQPYVALVERDNSTPLGLMKLYIRTSADSGTTVTTLAGPLNIDTKFGWASVPSLTNDGTALYVSWTEQGAAAQWTNALATYQGAFGEKPRVYADKVTTGGVVTRLGTMLNASPQGAATGSQITILGSNPIVTWSEVSPGTMRQVYAKTLSANLWSFVGSNVLTVTSPGALPASTIGASYSQSITSQASGGTPPYGSWTVASGSLPTGLSLGSGTGLISGTVGGSPGTSTFTVSVTDAVPNTATGENETITINAAPAITTASPLPNCTIGAVYSQALAASGGTLPLTWSVSTGTLSGSGVSLGSNGIVSGTCAGSPGVYNFTAKATDSVSVFGTKAFSMTVVSPGADGLTISGNTVVTGSASPQ